MEFFLLIFLPIIISFVIAVTIKSKSKENQTPEPHYDIDDHLNRRLTDNLRSKLEARQSALFQAAKAGGNVGYIAQNVATIYYCICNYADKNGELSENQRIYASLLIDAAAYLKNGSIDPKELQTSVQMANAYEIGGNFFCLHHVYNLFGTDAPDKYAKLICATADLEVLMFSADSAIGYRAVIDHVMKSISKIESMVIKTIEQGESSPLFENLLPSVLWCFHQPSFLEDVKSLKSVAPNYSPEDSSFDDVPF